MVTYAGMGYGGAGERGERQRASRKLFTLNDFCAALREPIITGSFITKGPAYLNCLTAIVSAKHGAQYTAAANNSKNFFILNDLVN